MSAIRRCAPGAALGLAVFLSRSVGADVVVLTDDANKDAVCESELMQGVVDVDGLEDKFYLAGTCGKSTGSSMTLQHNAALSLFSKCEEEWKPESIAQLKLLGRTISFTIDLSKVGCACNAAFYLISSPARDWEGRLSEGTDRGGQPPYYCDANQVGGQWCPEVDIMEANNHVLQSTPHKCDKPQQGHYSNCDRSGCAQSTNNKQGSYGPGPRYTIDTTLPFVVATSFPEEDGELLGMRAVLQQGDRKVVLAHDMCDPDYLASLSDAMKDGMSLRVTYWGDSAQTMAWMDQPPCGLQECSGENAGEAVISNITVSPPRPLSYFKKHGFERPVATSAAPGGNPWWSPDSTPAPAENAWWSADPATAPGGNRWWSPPATAATSGQDNTRDTHKAAALWVPDTSAEWTCHENQDAGWCTNAGIQDGVEYAYNGGQASPCGGCWCCRRKAKLASDAGKVWIVFDVKDPLHGQKVPDEIMLSALTVVKLVDHGVVYWKGSQHFVKQVRRGSDGNPCFDDACELAADVGRTDVFMQKAEVPAKPVAAPAQTAATSHFAMAGAASFVIAAMLAIAGVAVAARRLRLRKGAQPATSAKPSTAPGAEGGEAPVAEKSIGVGESPAMRRKPGPLDTMPSSAQQSGAHMRRSGSSCQTLLSFLPQETEV